MQKDIHVSIYLERMVDVIGEDYNPLVPAAQPRFFAHIINVAEDQPTEIELRLTNIEGNYTEVIITPRQLNAEGDIRIPIFALEQAIEAIQTRTEENQRVRTGRVSAIIEGSAFDPDNEAGS